MKRDARKKSASFQKIPPALKVFAWNLGEQVGPFGRNQIALNVIERGRAWHWHKLPKGWFDLQFCLQHGQRRTKEVLREWFQDQV
jgi:hypothetical protein